MATDADDTPINCLIGQENTSTVMKGVLWQQPNYGKFHQRIFTRWKKRYFILTTDYLVCFKRSTAKVGRSKMGEFLYKTSLSDILKIEWLKPTKSDKGAIVLLIDGQFNLSLWCKKNLDEWMYVIQEAVERNKLRRLRNSVQNEAKLSKTSIKCNSNHVSQNFSEDLYENALANALQQQKQQSIMENVRLDDQRITHNLTEIKEENIKETLTNGSDLISETKTTHSNIDGKFPSPRKANINSRSQRKIIVEEGKIEKTGSSDEKCANKSLSSHSSNEKVFTQMHRKDNQKEVFETESDEKKKEQTSESRKTNNTDSSGSGKEAHRKESQTINDLSRDNKSNESSRDSSNGSKERKRSIESQPSELTTNSSTSGNSSKIPKNSPLRSSKGSNKANVLRNDDQRRRASSSNHSSSADPESDKSGNTTKKDSIGSLTKPLDDSIEKVKEDVGNLLRSESKSRDSEDKKNKAKRKNIKAIGRKESSSTSESDPASCNSNNQQSDQEDESKTSDIEKKNSNNSKRVSNSNKNKEETHPTPTSEPNNNNINLSDKLIQRPAPTSLIRRDDSWQSLVSLTRVGKAKQNPMQVAQRSLYAQHIMPESASNDKLHNHRQHMINIESTVTPSRLPPSMMRQQWIQANSLYNNNSTNHIGTTSGLHNRKQGASSFDAPLPQNSPLIQHPMSKPNITSYQHKLLQLQLLHNSNNVDYIRHYGSKPVNDYQIYGPESITTNHYGYSSMRSNLKSAASEFSFIRPSSSGHNQSTLPHQPHQYHHQQENYSINHFLANNHNNGNPQTQLLNNWQPKRASLILNNQNKNLSPSQFNNKQHLTHDINNNDPTPLHHLSSPKGNQHYYINPMTSDRISGANQHQTAVVTPVFASYKQAQEEANAASLAMMDNKLMPPMRDLPPKPNKKRAQMMNAATPCDESGPQLRKSSSLTSSIGCFFRRVFSRRSKKGSRACQTKMAESCSSSLGNFEDGNFVPPLVPSAFSTGSKSVDGGRKNQSQQVVQSQRMIDMIEAFNNNTLAVQETCNPMANGMSEFADGEAGNQQLAQRLNHYKPNPGHFLGPSRLSGHCDGTAAGGSVVNADGVHEIMTPTQIGRRLTHTQLNQFGSPLHKSNSISATMGLSLSEANNLGRRALLYDNELLLNGPAAASNNNSTNIANASPMMMRSNKVMSTNLTPLMSRAVGEFNQQHRNSRESSEQQFFMSPRTSMKADQLPRPSSIYGQPSMISSPIMNRDEMRNNFGQHRNSFHSHHFRDLQAAKEGLSYLSGVGGHNVVHSNRRQQMVKLPFLLDTTREVAEELASPNESVQQNSVQHLPSRSNKNEMLDSPLSHGALYGRKQLTNRDIISASPSSGRLLNHYHQQQAIVNPILQSPTMDAIYDNHPVVKGGDQFASSSHYDNNHNLLIDQQQYHYQRRNNHKSPAMKLTSSTNNFSLHQSPEVLYSPRDGRTSQSGTPIRCKESRVNHDKTRFTVSDMISGNNRKPSAIVVPSHSNNNNNNDFLDDSSSPNHHYTSRNHHNPSTSLTSGGGGGGVSPLMGRRSLNQASHYQQSPLVSQQTRILTKGDGVQATIIGDKPAQVNKNRNQSCVKSATTENNVQDTRVSESSLIQSTDIAEAYECSNSDRFESESNYSSSKSNSKTFLDSTRLSKTNAHEQGSSSTVEDSLGSSCSSSAIVGSSLEKAPVPKQRRSIKDDNQTSFAGSKGSIHIPQKTGSNKTRNTSSAKQRKPIIQEDQLDDASLTSDKGPTNGGNGHKRLSNDSSSSSGVGQNNKYMEKSSSRLSQRAKGRESSTEPSESDTANTSQTDSLEKLERDRNWITSKLAE